MVRFLLHHLCGPAGKGFSPVLKAGSLPPDFDGLPAPDPAGTGKTQTAFFRVAGPVVSRPQMIYNGAQSPNPQGRRTSRLGVGWV